jgi:hypothetical protein
MMHDVLPTKRSAASAARTKTSQVSSGSLRIGAPNDAFEQEADRVANAVMAGQGSLGWSLAELPLDAPLRRKCACGGSGGAGGDCEECKNKEMLQRRVDGPSALSFIPPVVYDVLRSSGQPLDAAAVQSIAALQDNPGSPTHTLEFQAVAQRVFGAGIKP